MKHQWRPPPPPNQVQRILLAELSFDTLNIHLCNGLNDKNLVKPGKRVFLLFVSYCKVVNENMILITRRIYLYTMELFSSSFFTNQNFTPILNKNKRTMMVLYRSPEYYAVQINNVDKYQIDF